MKEREIAAIFNRTVERLSVNENNDIEQICLRHGEPMPSGKVLGELVELVRAVMFPGYFGDSKYNDYTLSYRTGVLIERIYILLCNQISAGLSLGTEGLETEERKTHSEEIALAFIDYLPQLRQELTMDVEAAYNGDPAATGFCEVISCYPVIKAVCNYRMAHKLYTLGVPLIPRIITEIAHSETGIDIHPGAQIGNYFTIDHGTGVVIGETCIIGNNVKLYQGVTLGAKSFPLDDNGNPIKGIPRHPILGDNVIVYSNATILGRITIGKNAVIGGNVWVTENVSDGAHVVQRK